MKILVGMSGGVDSSYAAYKLKSEGHTVVGAMLKMHEFSDTAPARAVCERIGIDLVEIDCTELFSEKVKRYFVTEYSCGRTPNPCIVCNREVKFKVLADYAREHGFDKIATGHYARIVETESMGERRFAFALSQDSGKDQTYMLYRLPQDVLSMLVLPLALEIKTDIKKIAAKQSLVPEDEEESQEICFIRGMHYTDYIIDEKGEFPSGDFVSDDGTVLGRHKGIIHYTVGQRKGLGISLGYRAFVSDIDPKTNRITLSEEGRLTDTVYVENIVFSGMKEPTEETEAEVEVRLRYQAKPVPATAHFGTDGTATLKLHTPAKAVTAGQSAVMYSADIVAAGGFIK